MKKLLKYGIFTRIVLLITAVIMLSTGTVLVVSSSRFTHQIENEVNTVLETEAREKITRFTDNLNLHLSMVEGNANNIEHIEHFIELSKGVQNEDRRLRIKEELTQEINLKGDIFENMMTVGPDGIIHVDGIGGVAEGRNLNESKPLWYMNVINSKETSLGELEMSPVKEKTPVFPKAAPIKDENGNLVGVTMVAINLKAFAKDVVTSDINSGTQTIVVDDTGKVVLSENEEDMFSYSFGTGMFNEEKTDDEVIEFFDKISKEKTGMGTFIKDGIKYMAYFDTTTAIGETEELHLIVYQPEELYTDPINKVTNLLIVLMIVSVGLGIALSVAIAKYIADPIKKASEQLTSISNGDYTREEHKSFIERTDEFGVLGNSIDKMQHNTKVLVESLHGNVENLESVTKLIAEAISNSTGSINSVSNKTSEMSYKFQDNASASEEIAASIEELVRNMQLVSEQLKTIDSNSENILGSTRSGMDNMNSVVETIDKVKESTNKVQSVFQNLRTSSNKINDIVELITDVSERTNLLALNASIEAARAGEAGKGFAVVADEVRKLAEQSRESAEIISSLVREIQDEIINSGKIIEEEQSFVKQSVNVTTKTQSEFQSILEAISNMSLELGEVSRMYTAQANISNEMERAINDIANTTNENASIARDINSDIENQADTFNGVTSQIEELNEMAMELKDNTNKFKIK